MCAIVFIAILFGLISSSSGQTQENSCGAAGKPADGAYELLEHDYDHIRTKSNSWEPGTRIRYFCYKNGLMVAPDDQTERVCRNGVWRPQGQPLCIRPVKLRNPIIRASKKVTSFDFLTDNDPRSCSIASGIFDSQNRTRRYFKLESIKAYRVLAVKVQRPESKSSDYRIVIKRRPPDSEDRIGDEESIHECRLFNESMHEAALNDLNRCTSVDTTKTTKFNYDIYIIDLSPIKDAYFIVCEIAVYLDSYDYNCGQVDGPGQGSEISAVSSDDQKAVYSCKSGKTLARQCDRTSGRWEAKEPKCIVETISLIMIIIWSLVASFVVLLFVSSTLLIRYFFNKKRQLIEAQAYGGTLRTEFSNYGPKAEYASYSLDPTSSSGAFLGGSSPFSNRMLPKAPHDMESIYSEPSEYMPMNEHRYYDQGDRATYISGISPNNYLTPSIGPDMPSSSGYMAMNAMTSGQPQSSFDDRYQRSNPASTSQGRPLPQPRPRKRDSRKSPDRFPSPPDSVQMQYYDDIVNDVDAIYSNAPIIAAVKITSASDRLPQL